LLSGKAGLHPDEHIQQNNNSIQQKPGIM